MAFLLAESAVVEPDFDARFICFCKYSYGYCA